VGRRRGRESAAAPLMELPCGYAEMGFKAVLLAKVEWLRTGELRSFAGARVNGEVAPIAVMISREPTSAVDGHAQTGDDCYTGN